MVDIILSLGFLISVLVWVVYLIVQVPKEDISYPDYIKESENNTNKSKTPTDT